MAEALQRVGPVWFSRDVQVQPDTVLVVACRKFDPAACVDVRLGRPDLPCAGTIAGPFCATGSALDPVLLMELRAALVAPAAAWTTPGAGNQIAGYASFVPPERRGGVDEPRCSVPRLLALVCLVALVPWLAGWGAGRALRDLFGRTPLRWRRPLFGGVLAALAWLLVALRFGAWDAAWLLCVAAAGFFVGQTGRRGLRWLGAVVVVAVLGLVLAEAVARLIGMAAPELPPAACAELRVARSILAPETPSRSCQAVVPAGSPQRLMEAERGVASDEPAVLHLGDSMIAPFGVAPTASLLARLAAAMPEVHHFDASCPGTAIDYHALVGSIWAGKRHFERAVVYLYPGNDLTDLGAPSPCCGDRGWFEFPKGGGVVPCAPVAPQQSPWRVAVDLVASSPLPYVLRAATGVSVVARGLVGAWVRRGWQPLRLEVGLERTLLLVEWLQHQLTARGTTLALVLVPTRRAWEHGPERNELDFDRAVKALAARSDLPVLDLLDVLPPRDPVDDPDGPYDSPDGHFGPRGHLLAAQAVARFLRSLAPRAAFF